MRKYKVKYDKLPTQAKVFDDDTTKTIIQSMGLGGGKTYNLCMKAIKLSMINKGVAGGILAPTYRDFKRDILPTMEDILDEHRIPFKYHRTEQWFKFPWNKKPIYVFSAEKPIAGPNLGYCLINEFSLIQYVRINEMMRRVRVKNCPSPQKILVGTPEDVHGWLEEFVEAQEKLEMEQEGTFKIHYGSSEENTHIDEEYAKFLEQTLDEQSLEIFKHGKIGRIGGEYFYYAFTTEKNVDDSVIFNPDEHVWIGVDFNVSKMAITFAHKRGDTMEFFADKMLTGDSDTESTANYILENYGHTDFTVICDASGNNRKTIANKDGLRRDVSILRSILGKDRVKFKAANARLRKRQLQNASMMSHGRVKAHSRCKGLILDWKKTKQKPDWTKDEGKEGKFSHFSDCSDYILDWVFKFDLGRDRKSSSSRL
jgi:hypothetical protein